MPLPQYKNTKTVKFYTIWYTIDKINVKLLFVQIRFNVVTLILMQSFCLLVNTVLW